MKAFTALPFLSLLSPPDLTCPHTTYCVLQLNVQMAHLGDIPTQFWGPDEWNEALPYAMLRGNFVAPVTHKDYSKMAMDNIQYLMHRSIADVRRGALAGKADDVLELAARYVQINFEPLSHAQ